MAADGGVLFVFEVDDFGAEELGEGGVAAGEGEGAVAGIGVVAEGEVGDGVFDQFAGFGFGEVADPDKWLIGNSHPFIEDFRNFWKNFPILTIRRMVCQDSDYVFCGTIATLNISYFLT